MSEEYLVDVLMDDEDKKALDDTDENNDIEQDLSQSDESLITAVMKEETISFASNTNSNNNDDDDCDDKDENDSWISFTSEILMTHNEYDSTSFNDDIAAPVRPSATTTFRTEDSNNSSNEDLTVKDDNLDYTNPDMDEEIIFLPLQDRNQIERRSNNDVLLHSSTKNDEDWIKSTLSLALQA